MIDDTDFGFLLIVGMVAIFLGGLVWHMLNEATARRPRTLTLVLSLR
jgi:hypothetical protein